VNVRPVLDVRTLSPYSYRTDGALWWGMMGMIVIETAVFAMLVASYFYLKSQHTHWPLGGFDPPKLLLPTINTGVLIASSIVMHWADAGVEQDDQRRLRVGMIVAALLAGLFLVLKYVEYSAVPYRWDSNAYGSMVWTIIGFHSAHVMVLLAKTIVVATLAMRGFFDSRRRMGVIINGMYWHFVVAVWIPLYVVLYWSPRWS
jgi:heme/copper-type cytochrome/quinol oxidase subunit 3